MAKLRIDIQGKIDTGLMRSIRELNTLLSQSANNLKTISAELGRTGAAFARTRTPATAAAGSYREAQQSLAAMLRAIRNAEGGFNSINTTIQRQISAYRSLNAQLKEFDRNMGIGYRNVGNHRSSVAGLTRSLGLLTTAYTAVRIAISSVSGAFRSAMQTDALRTSFAFILDDSEERLARLRKQAELLGLQYVTLGNTYRKFIAAADASNFSLTQADKIFNAVANAGAKLKLSNEQVEGTFLAIEQMISKGTVSMEELRRQLGDRLPGAFGMAARAMGMTEEAFNKLVASGQVQAADLLPKLAEEINKQYGLATESIVSLQASVNRLKNSFDLLVQDSNVQAFFRSVIDLANQLVRSFGMLVTSRLSTELRDEQSALGSLRVELESTNTSAERRQEIIEQLIAQYPHYLRDVDADKVKNGELLPILDRINDSYRDRIALQQRIEKHSLTFEQEATMINRQFDAMQDVAKRIAAIQDRIRGTGVIIPEGTVSEKAEWIIKNLNKELGNLQATLTDQSQINGLRTSLGYYNAYTSVLDRVSASADKARKEIQDFSQQAGLTETEGGFIDLQKLTDDIQGFYDVLNRARQANAITAQEYSGFEQRLKESGYDDATRRELLAEIERFELERRKKVVELDKATLRERERLRKAGLKALAELTDTSSEQVTIEGTEAAKIEKKYADLGKKAGEAFRTALAGGVDGSTALTAYTEKVNQLNIAKAAELARNQAKIEAKEAEDRMRLLSNIRIQYERRANQDISQLVMNSINDRYRREVELANKLAKDQLWTEEQRLAKQQELQEKYWRQVESISSISAIKNAGFFALQEGLKQAEKDFKRFLATIENEAERSRLKDLFKEYSDAIKDGAASDLARGLRDIGSELSGIVDIFTGLDQGFGRSLQALSRLADTYNRIAKSIYDLTKSASNIATPFSANPWVSAIGAGISIIGGIWNAIASSRSKQKQEEQQRIAAMEEERKRINDFYADASRGELSYQNLLRRREMDLARRAAGGDLYGIKAQIETAIKQIPQIEKEFDRVFKKLQSKEYIAGFEEVIGKELFLKNTWFGKVLRSRDAVIGYREALASLSDLDFDEIEQLFEQGLLTEEAKKDFESLRDLRDEIEATGMSIEDLQDQMNQLLTGTTITSLADRIEQMFAAGTTSAEDFAKSFEEIMRDAMFSAFQAKYAVRYLEPFFEELAAQMDSEVFDTGRLERMYGDAANKYVEGLELLEQATGISLRDLQTGGDPRGLTGSIERLSEQTGSELTGLYRATFELNKQELGYVQRLAVSNDGILVAVQGSADVLADIASTNAEIAENTSHLESIAEAVERVARNTDNKSMRDIGL